jgi:hypothetical protein
LYSPQLSALDQVAIIWVELEAQEKDTIAPLALEKLSSWTITLEIKESESCFAANTITNINVLVHI